MEQTIHMFNIICELTNLSLNKHSRFYYNELDSFFSLYLYYQVSGCRLHLVVSEGRLQPVSLGEFNKDKFQRTPNS